METKSIAFVGGLALGLILSGGAFAVPFTNGDVFAAVNNGHVNEYSSTGVFIQQLNTGQGGFTTGMAFDSSQNLNVTNFSAGSITRFAPSGVVLPPNPFVSPGSAPESVLFSSTGLMYVGRAGGNAQQYSSTGTLLTTFSMGQNTDWIDLASDQNTLFFNDEGGTIREWNVTTNTSAGTFANNTAHGGTNSFALRILPNGGVLSAAGNEVIQYDSSGNVVKVYDVAGVDGFFALNLDTDGSSFWTGSFANGTLYKFLIGGTTPTLTINTGVGASSLFGVAVAGEVTAGCGTACGGGGGTTDVPEPATLSLFAVLAAFIPIRRRKKRIQPV